MVDLNRWQLSDPAEAGVEFPMALHLVPGSLHAKPARRARARQEPGNGAAQLRLIECRADLYALLSDSWQRKRRAWLLPAVLLCCFALIAVATMIWNQG
jgi:hypothetical protein